MPLQLSISFDPTHLRENNPLSQEYLDQHRDKFSNDCFDILKRLVSGERLTVKTAINAGLSGDLRARIRDIRNFGMHVSDERQPGGYKEYFFSVSDSVKALEVLLKKGELKAA